MTTEKAVEKLTQLLNEVSDLKKLPPFSTQFKSWRTDTEETLEEFLGDKTRFLEAFQGVSYRVGLVTEYTTHTEFQEAFFQGLDEAANLLERIIKRIS